MHQRNNNKSINPSLNTTSQSSPSSSSSFSKSSIFLLVTMASLVFLSLLSLLLFFSLSSASHRHRNHNHQKPDSTQPSIIQACKSTRYQSVCETSLLQSDHLPPNPTPLQIIHSSLSISAVNLETATSMVRSIKDSSVGDKNRTTAAINCLEALRNSRYRLNLTDEALPRGRVKDARAWVSASLLFQYDCWSGLKYANDTDQVNQTMSFMNTTLIVSTSNALSMLMSYDLFGNVTASWKPPGTERTGTWDVSGQGGQTGLGFKGGVPSLLTDDVTVCKEGGCQYKTVQEAVDVAPEHLTVRKFVIRIKEGVYEEAVRIPLEKTNVVFMGDGMGKTVITGSLNVGMPGLSTTNTATVGVTGDGFMAYGITFQNTAGPDAHQAVAFRSDSDLSIIENCEFIGNQDTLYAHSLRQFYKSCRIQGNVDFIFGNSASVFQDCTILISPRQTNPEKGETNAVTAHGRTDPAQTTGFVFQNCLINGTDAYMSYYFAKPKAHKNFLGRPWKEFSRTVFIHCDLEALVSPQGWLPWSGDFALETLYYGEFENSGPGSDTSQRVAWSSQIPSEHVFGYSVASFIQGDQWIPISY